MNWKWELLIVAFNTFSCLTFVKANISITTSLATQPKMFVYWLKGVHRAGIRHASKKLNSPESYHLMISWTKGNKEQSPVSFSNFGWIAAITIPALRRRKFTSVTARGGDAIHIKVISLVVNKFVTHQKSNCLILKHLTFKPSQATYFATFCFVF